MSSDAEQQQPALEANGDPQVDNQDQGARLFSSQL